MIDGLPKNYDALRTRNDWDEADEIEQQHIREQRLIDKADAERDRRKDEAHEHTMN